MPKLTNDKHERFCHMLAEGTKSWRTIMQILGYKENQSQYSTLKNSDKIQDRLSELIKDVVSDKIMGLTSRLELLTDFIKDINQSKGFRLACLRELHEQCGDKVKKMDVTQTNENVVKIVEAKLPMKSEDVAHLSDVNGNLDIDEDVEAWLKDS